MFFFSLIQLCSNEIRRKRLAKLSSGASGSSNSDSKQETDKGENEKVRSEIIKNNTQRNSRESLTGNERSLNRSINSGEVTKSQQQRKADESHNQMNSGIVKGSCSNVGEGENEQLPKVTKTLPFGHRFIKEVFHVTFDKEEPNDTYTYLSYLAQELEDEIQMPVSSDTYFTFDMLDRLVWSRMTQHKVPVSPFDYLLGCYTRCSAIRRRLKVKEAELETKTKLLDEMERQCVAMTCVFSTSDIMEEQQQVSYPSVGVRLVSKASSGREPLPWEFFNAVIAYSEEQGLLTDLLTPIIIYLRDELSKVGYSGDYKPFITVMEHLVTNKNVCIALVESPYFSVDGDDGDDGDDGNNNNNKSSITPSQIATSTILGPFLSISPLDGRGCIQIFGQNPDILSQPEIERRGADMCSEIRIIQNRLFFIVDRIVRSSPTARQAVLKYFGRIIDLNHRRTAHRLEPNTTSTDGFMLNITMVLAKFSEPFVDSLATKINKVNFDYFRHQPMYDITEETKLLSDLSSSKQFYSTTQPGDVNFISHIFFLTCAYFHYGLGGTIQSQQRLKRTTDEVEEQIALLEVELRRWGQNDPRQNVAKSMMERFRTQRVAIKSLKLALERTLHDVEQMTTFYELAIFQLTFLVRAAQPSHQYPTNNSLILPFSGDIPEEFSNYPEFILESPITLVLYASRQLPQILVRNPSQRLVESMVAFLRNTSFIKNPYLKSKLVEVLFFGTLDMTNGVKGYFINLFDSDPVCLDHLFHALMNFYIEVERTGTSSQFYDKFNTRYYISQIIKNIWSNDVYRNRLKQESEKDVDFFVHFVALLLNDSTYLLDESLSALTEIHKLQKELGDSLPHPGEDQETKEKRQQLANSEKHAQSFMQLTNQTVLLLKLFTSVVPEAFVTPEIIDRLGAMLNYNLAALVGPKCRELKVKTPEKYSFNPRLLLSDLLDVYLNLLKHDVFVKSIARDGRSYNATNFNRAIDILSRWTLKTPQQLNALRKFVNQTESVKQDDEEGELELGEIPDEFLDPLMYTIMEEPVTLPSSKVNIDLSTIKSHLLSDAKDPFNREPLKLEDVVPNHELKSQIEDFKRKRREEYRKNKMDESN